MANRLPCKTPDCTRTILPSTAEATGGFCRPCVTRRKEEERERFIRTNRVEVNRFDGVTDVVEVLRLIHMRPKHDRLIVQLPYGESTEAIYRRLSQEDAERLVAVAVAAKNEDLMEAVATNLACHSEVDLGSCQRALLVQGDPYPAHPFRGAGEGVVDELFGVLEESVRNEDTVRLDHALCALAWARSTRVVEAMAGWSRERPAWSQLLHVAPEAYARVAGFELEGETVRELTLPRAFKMVPTGESEAGAQVSLFGREVGGLACGRCARPATVLARLVVSGLPELEGALPGCVVTCLECACWGTVFVRYEAGAGWVSVSGGEAAGRDYGWALAPRAAKLVPCGVWETVDWCEGGHSRVGGHPRWINDFEYPPCPGCTRSMPTVMQVGLEDFSESGGIFYVHYCSGCTVVGVSYQQT